MTKMSIRQLPPPRTPIHKAQRIKKQGVKQNLIRGFNHKIQTSRSKHEITRIIDKKFPTKLELTATHLRELGILVVSSVSSTSTKVDKWLVSDVSQYMSRLLNHKRYRTRREVILAYTDIFSNYWEENTSLKV